MKNKPSVSDLVSNQATSAFMDARTNEGILVLGLLPNSIAARAGVRKLDRIMSVNKSRIYSLSDYMAATENHNGIIELDVIREDKNIKLVLDFNPVPQFN